MNKNVACGLFGSALAFGLPFGDLAAEEGVEADYGVSGRGNIGIYSKYVFRGLQQPNSETNGPALQGGFELNHLSGAYAGYWGSNLDARQVGAKSGVENNVYAGYAGEVGELEYAAGALYYKYISIDHADAPELFLDAAYGHFGVGMEYLAQDVEWGNAGDIYWTADFETELPLEFGMQVEAGYYTYAESGKYVEHTEISNGFRNLNVSITHPMGHSGAVMSLTGILGGVDREDRKQGSTAVLGVDYEFDI